MTSPLISSTTNAPSTIVDSFIDIPNNEQDEEKNHWHELTLAEHDVSNDVYTQH